MGDMGRVTATGMGRWWYETMGLVAMGQERNAFTGVKWSYGYEDQSLMSCVRLENTLLEEHHFHETIDAASLQQ